MLFFPSLKSPKIKKPCKKDIKEKNTTDRKVLLHSLSQTKRLKTGKRKNRSKILSKKSEDLNELLHDL